jgi:multisubunit Na+/H+ antiporter MnhB subunit
VKTALQVAVLALCAVLAAGLAALVLTLPAAPPALPQQIAARLADSGVSHPVTAVLLNFRAYDTLLEVGVLLLAVAGALGLREPGERGSRPAAVAVDPVLSTLVRLGVPLMLLTSGYLLWAGATRPGGAFQAAAVLAGAGVLVHLSRVAAPARIGETLLRAAIALGFAVFLAVGIAAAASSGSLLGYPPGTAGALILLIEAALTVSIAVGLVSLFLAAPAFEEDGR